MNPSLRTDGAQSDPGDEVEAGIREFVRNDIAYLRRPAESSAESPVESAPQPAPLRLAEPPRPAFEAKAAEEPQARPARSGSDRDAIAVTVGAVVQRTASASIEEIDRLIAELQDMRGVLRSRGERLQDEISDYVRLGRAAEASTRAIGEQVSLWKQALATGPRR